MAISFIKLATSEFKMNGKLKDFAIFAAILTVFFSFVYRNYFGLGGLINGDLGPFYYRSGDSIDAFFSSWINNNLGYFGSSIESGFFNGLLLLIVGNDSILAQKIYFLSLMPLASITMFIFLTYYIGSRFGRFLMSFVYGVNPLTIGLFFGGSPMLVPYALLPLMLMFLLNFFEKKRGQVRNILVFTLILAFSSSYNVQTPVFVLPFIIVILLVNLAMKKSLKPVIKTISMLLVSSGLFLLLTIPSTSIYAASVFDYYFGSVPGSINYYGVAPKQAENLIEGVRNDFTYHTFDFLNLCIFLTAIPAFFTLFVKNKFRLKYILSLLLLLSAVVLFWTLGLKDSTLWLYEEIPLLFAINTIKLKMIMTQAYILIIAFLIDEAQEKGIIGLTYRRITATKELPS